METFCFEKYFKNCCERLAEAVKVCHPCMVTCPECLGHEVPCARCGNSRQLRFEHCQGHTIARYEIGLEVLNYHLTTIDERKKFWLCKVIERMQEQQKIWIHDQTEWLLKNGGLQS